MILNGITFPDVFNAAGARNFFCQGWPHHRWLGPLAPDFAGAGFVAKTTTLNPHPGNMPLGGDLMPRERFPACIRVNFRRAAVLNAVGLSGPGLAALLADGRWQTRSEPFLLSFAAVADTFKGRLAESITFGDRIAAARCGFLSPFGIEINFSCPNVGHGYPANLVGEAANILEAVAGRLPGVPLIPKVNALVPVETAFAIADEGFCAAFSVSNTIPWGEARDRIDWRSLFGSKTSPLASLGGGGLSGAPILPLVAEWVNAARRAGFPKPIIAGGGIMSAGDVGLLRSLGASAVEVGSAAIVRPWRVRSIIGGWR